MNWCSPNGNFREATCRKALVALHRRKLIELSDCGDYAFRTRRGAMPSELPSLFSVNCSLAELGPAQRISAPSASCKNARIWNALLDTHYYMGSGPLCCVQIRYLIWSHHLGWLGGLSFSASALRLRCWEKFIGWSEEACRLNLQRVVNNSRFLIFPTVKVSDLASHVMAECCKRLLASGRNAIHTAQYCSKLLLNVAALPENATVQQTGSMREQPAAVVVREPAPQLRTSIFILSGERQETLCSLLYGAMSIFPQPPQSEPADWIEEEFGRAVLGDKYLIDRLMQLGDFFSPSPRPTFPKLVHL